MEWFRLAQRSLGKGLPETGYQYSKATIYRAVAHDVTLINDMDYVTMSLGFAKGHADHQAAVEDESYHVLRARVPANTVFEAYNPGEFFYHGPSVQGQVVYQAKTEEQS